MAVDVPRQPAQVGRHVGDQLGQRARLTGQEQVVQHLDERLVGHPGVLGGRAHQHRDALLVQRAGGLGRQPGLARTGFAAEQDDLAVALHTRSHTVSRTPSS